MNLDIDVEQKTPETVEYKIYDSTYMKFKSKQYYGDRGQKSGYLCGENTDWEGAQGSLLGGRNEIFLDLGGGYTGVSIPAFIKLYIKICYTSTKKQIR